MKLSDSQFEKLFKNLEFEKIINNLSKVVVSDEATFEDYAYFVKAVSAFVDKVNYPLAYQCFILANLADKKNEKLLKEMYEQIMPIIKSLGFSYFNDNNTNKINEYYYLLARFILLINSSKYSDAIKTISQMIKIFPSPTNYLQRSKVHLKQKHFKLALKDLDNGLEINPKNHDLLFHRALIKQKMEDLKGAFIDLDLAINIYPDNPLYYFHRGLVQEELERFKNALDDFKKTIQLDSNNVNAFNEIAWCNYKLGNYRDALSFSNIAIDMNKNNSSGYYVRGTIENNIKLYNDAIIDLDKAIKLDNCSDKIWTSKIWYQKAWADFKIEDYKQAQKDILEAIKFSNRCITYQLLAMDIEYFGLKNYLNAKSYCQEVLKLDPDNARALAAQKYIVESIQKM